MAVHYYPSLSFLREREDTVVISYNQYIWIEVLVAERNNFVYKVHGYVFCQGKRSSFALKRNDWVFEEPEKSAGQNLSRYIKL